MCRNPGGTRLRYASHQLVRLAKSIEIEFASEAERYVDAACGALRERWNHLRVCGEHGILEMDRGAPPG